MLAVLEWARVNGVEMTSVSVGGCRVELARTGSAVQGEAPVRTRPGIYPQFGGDMLRHAAAGTSGERVHDENGLQPALGRG